MTNDATIPSLPEPDSTGSGWPWTSRSLKASESKDRKWPRITIVTPSFNQGHFIEETIRSILQQGYPNLEYMVVDGGSKDRTVDILKKYSPWIDWWVSEKDGGQSEAINKGWKRGTGDIFAYLNSDDWYAPDALWRIAEEFTGNPSVRWVTGEVIYCRSSSDIVRKLKPTEKSLAECLGQKPNGGIVQPGTFWHREIVEKVGWFDESLHYQFDHEYIVRCMVAGFKSVLIDDSIAYYRLHEDSKTVSQMHRFLEDDWEVYRRYCHHLDDDGRRVARGWLDHFEKDILIDTVYSKLQRRDRAGALAYLLKRIRLQPGLKPPGLYWGALYRILSTGRPPEWFQSGKKQKTAS